MTLGPWHEVAIGKEHDRGSFDCGESDLNEYLQKHARKNHERGGSNTFLAVRDNALQTVWGFYTISPASVAYARTTDIVRRW